MKPFIKHIFRLFILLAIVILLFTAGRLIMYFSNNQLFENFGFSEIFYAIFNGVEYDFLVVLFINSLFIFLFLWPLKIYNSILYQFFLKFIFFLFNAAAILINLFDVRQVQIYGHRLRTFELKDEIALFVRELQKMQLKEIVASYLSLTVYFIIFLFIIWQSLKLILKIQESEKRGSIIRKWTGFVLLLTIAGIFIFNYGRNENYLTKLYLKADRKLAPLVMNNPYLLISTYGVKKIETQGDWELHEFPSIKKYDFAGAESIKNIKLIIIEQNSIQDIKKDENYFPVYTLKNEPQSLFQLLDEVFLSFPGIYTNGFYLSTYSLNKFESLIEQVKEKGYAVKLTVIGYSSEVEKLIRNFYGSNGVESKDANNTAKSFEIILINATVNEDNIAAAGTDMISDNELIIRLYFGGKQEQNKGNKLKRTISFTSLNKLPFYKPIDSIVSQSMDIKPSLLQLIGYNKAFTAYGNSLFAADDKVLFQNLSDTSSMVLIDSLLLDFSNNETIKLNKLKGMEISDMDFKDSLAVERIILENKIQSILNNFKQRLKNNSL